MAPELSVGLCPSGVGQGHESRGASVGGGRWKRRKMPRWKTPKPKLDKEGAAESDRNGAHQFFSDDHVGNTRPTVILFENWRSKIPQLTVLARLP